MTTEERKRRRFTESFRKEQVELIESGRTTIAQVSRRYEVRANNVRKWLEKYGKKKEEEGLIMVGGSKDYDRLAQLEKDHSELQILFGQQQVQLVRLQKLLDLAKAQLGDEFEKKCSSHY